ncbi:acylphosphatase-2 isoform X1 [Lithobates pipiens]
MRTAWILALAFICMTMSGLTKASNTLKSVDYEVFGRVQGVCFRMYTEDEAKKLGVVGWVKNTRQGTVVGQVQGPEDRVNSMFWCEPNWGVFGSSLLAGHRSSRKWAWISGRGGHRGQRWNMEGEGLAEQGGQSQFPD